MVVPTFASAAMTATPPSPSDAEINGVSAAKDGAAPFLIESGFAITAMGLQLRVARRLHRPPALPSQAAEADASDDDSNDEELATD